MTIQLINQHKQWLVLAALVLTLAGVFVARTAFARITFNTIDPVGIVAHNGRHVTLTGPLAVTAGERVQMRVTVSQRTTAAVAEGGVILTGTGTTNHWEVEAAVQGNETFEAGAATATAIAVTSAGGGQATDAHQWLVNIALVKE